MVGLAAMQLGVGRRIIAVDVTADGSNKSQNLRILINPKITTRSEEEVVPGREGCWSCGSICGNVNRSQTITTEALDRTGARVEYRLFDFVARVAQHEIDHLEGIRFPDRIPTNEPSRVHIVHPSEFPEYRLKWANWKTICPRERWEEMKSGVAE